MTTSSLELGLLLLLLLLEGVDDGVKGRTGVSLQGGLQGPINQI